MIKESKLFAICCFSVIGLFTTAESGWAGLITADGRDNIYQSELGTPGQFAIGSGQGLIPQYITIPVGAIAIQFSSVTGTWCYMHDYFPGQDVAPDGLFQPSDGFHTGTDLQGINNYSGVRHDNRVMFLAGLFVDISGPPLLAPSALDFSGAAEQFGTLSASLGQVFFIGDGRTDGNLLQTFYVPATAVRLYLGAADGVNFQGMPGYYSDNSGSLDATYDFLFVQEAPEPATWLLIAGGLGAMLLRRRAVKS